MNSLLVVLLSIVFISACQSSNNRMADHSDRHRSMTSVSSVTIENWSDAKGGILNAVDLGEKKVIELNPDEQTNPFSVKKFQIYFKDSSQVIISCRNHEDRNRSAAGSELFKARGSARQARNYRTVFLEPYSGALINESTVVMCRAADKPARAFKTARIKDCTYDVSRKGTFTVLSDIVTTDDNNLLLGIPANELPTQFTVQVNGPSFSSTGDEAMKQKLVNACQASIPNPYAMYATEMPEAKLSSAGISNNYVNFKLDGLVNDFVPRSVEQVCNAMLNGGDVHAQIPRAWYLKLRQQNSERAHNSIGSDHQ